MESAIYTLQSRAEALQIKLNRHNNGVEALSVYSFGIITKQLSDHKKAIAKLKPGEKEVI